MTTINYIKTYTNGIFKVLFTKSGQNISSLIGGNVLVSGLGSITTILILRNSTDELVSTIYPLITIITIFCQLFDFGSTNSFIKGHHVGGSIARDLFFSFKVLCGLTMALFMMPVCWFFKDKLISPSFPEFYLFWTALAAFFNLMTNYTNSVLQIDGKFNRLLLTKLLPNLAKLIIIFIFIKYINLNLNALMSAFFLVPVLSFFSGMNHIPKLRSLIKYENRKILSNILKSAPWLFASGLVTTLIGQTDILMIKAMSTSNQLNLLLGGQKLSSLFPIIVNSLMLVLLPKLTSSRSMAELKLFFRKIQLFVPIIIILLLLGLLTADLLIPFILGAKYVGSIGIFKYYLVGFAISLYITPISIIMVCLNLERKMTILNIMQLVTNIVGNFILIPYLDAEGAALSSLVIRILALAYVLYHLGLFGFFKKENANEN